MKWLTSIVFVTMAAAQIAAGETVSHPQLGFRLSVPDGFAQHPESVQGDVLYAFHRPPAGEQQMGMIIGVSRLNGVLSREKIDPKQLSVHNPQATIVRESWKGFDIEVCRIPETLGDLRVVTFNADVPLKPEAIQIKAIAEAANEEELLAVLRSVLVQLDGQTNWLNTEQRVARFAEGISRLAITAAALLVVTGIVWRAVRGRSSARRAAEPGAAADGGGG